MGSEFSSPGQPPPPYPCQQAVADGEDAMLGATRACEKVGCLLGVLGKLGHQIKDLKGRSFGGWGAAYYFCPQCPSPSIALGLLCEDPKGGASYLGWGFTSYVIHSLAL